MNLRLFALTGLLYSCSPPFLVPDPSVQLLEVPPAGLRAELDQDLGPLVSVTPDAHEPPRFEGGALVLDVRGNSGWYSDASGTLLAVAVRGDFLAETRVLVTTRTRPGARPTGTFTSAGLLIRDPSSMELQQRWVMYNVGFQDTFFGYETKTTRPFDGVLHAHNFAGYRSLSTLYLNPIDGEGSTFELRLCRVGSLLRFFARRPGEVEWTEQQVTARTQRWGNGDKEPTPGVADGMLRMERPDLPSLVQVGLILNAGSNQDARGHFDFFEVLPLAGGQDCR